MRRAAVATRALAARVNLWTVRPTSIFVAAHSTTQPLADELPIPAGRRSPAAARAPLLGFRPPDSMTSRFPLLEAHKRVLPLEFGCQARNQYCDGHGNMTRRTARRVGGAAVAVYDFET